MSECSGDSKPESSRFPLSSCSGQSNGRRRRPLGDGIDKREDSLGLVKSFGEFDEFPGRFCFEEGLFQTSELGLLFRLSGFVFQGFDIPPA